jgi:gliding motility-associated-like protein
VTVYVINHGGFRMPTAFTPNGDGKNETMYPVLAVGSQVTVFRVYNRWGQLVYDNPLPPGWTGNFGGNAQATDTYTYFVTVESPDPADAAKKVQKSVEGSFQLFR